ncbi:hypothetical protein Chor_000253 [Crotalus horridus]
MYVSYLLEKESPSMYPGSVRHAGGLNLTAAQNFLGSPQYPDYGAYHVPAGIGLDNAQSPGSPWPAAYGTPLRDDWNGYGQAGGPGTATAGALHGPSPTGLAYSPAGDYLPHPHHPSQGPPAPPCGVPPSAGLMQPLHPPLGSDPLSPGGQLRNFCDWMRKPTAGGPERNNSDRGLSKAAETGDISCLSASQLRVWLLGLVLVVVVVVVVTHQSSTKREKNIMENSLRVTAAAVVKTYEVQIAGSAVKTRTKDKYRVVYTDHQRLELEKEFHYSRYITIRRKAELAATLGLSERQVRLCSV